MPTDSLQRKLGEDGPVLGDTIGDSSREEKLIEHVSLKEAVMSLPDREKSVIVLRYYRGMTQSDSAKVLGISQVQVSRVEKRAVSRLKELLA